MDAQATAPIEPAPEDADAFEGSQAWKRELIERQLAILSRMAEAGLNITLDLERQAASSDKAKASCDIALAYARVSRAVRLTIALQSKLIEAIERLDRIEEKEEMEAAREEARARRAAKEALIAADNAHKGRIQVIVNRIADADHPNDPDTADRLVDEACEKLRDDDQFGDLLNRPISEVIALLCQDLGLSPDWPRLAEEAWAREEIAGGKVGSPLASLTVRAWETPPPGPPWPSPGLSRPRTVVFPASPP